MCGVCAIRVIEEPEFKVCFYSFSFFYSLPRSEENHDVCAQGHLPRKKLAIPVAQYPLLIASRLSVTALTAAKPAAALIVRTCSSVPALALSSPARRRGSPNARIKGTQSPRSFAANAGQQSGGSRAGSRFVWNRFFRLLNKPSCFILCYRKRSAVYFLEGIFSMVEPSGSWDHGSVG